MDAITGLLILVLMVCLYLFITYNNKNKWKNMPPGPTGLPVVGNLLSLRKEAHLTYASFMKYGEVCTVTIGMTPTILLNSYRAVQEALINQGDIFSGRARSEQMDAITRCSGIVFNDGPAWKEHRRFTLRLLREFGVGKSTVQEIICDECSRLRETLETLQGRPINTKEIFLPIVCNIISRLIFGERSGSDDPNFAEFERGMNYVGSKASIVVLPMFSWLLKLPFMKTLLPEVTKYIQSWELMHTYIHKKMKKHSDSLKNILRASSSWCEAKDICEAFLMEQTNQEESNPGQHTFTDWQLVRNMMELFAAGTDATGTTFSWTILLMATHPQIQRNIQSEIDENIGQERLPNMSDRSQLPYMSAVLDEVFRYTSLVTSSLPHRTLQDTELLGYFIPANTIVQTNLYGIHHDPDLWERPHEFYPEHFLTAEGAYRPSKYLIPFSIGKRACLGESLARMQTFLIFVSIMQNFEVRMADSKVDVAAILRGQLGLALHPLPHEIIFSKKSQDQFK